MYKTILFYKFTPLSDAQAVGLWQRSIAERAEVLGRVIVSPHGINAAVGGPIDRVKAYLRSTKEYPAFRKLDVKWSGAEADIFPRLSVRVTDELVSFGLGDALQVTEQGVQGTGQHLRPQEVHELVEKYGDDVVFFDGRNAYEAAIGKFQKALVPDTQASFDFPREIASGRYDDLADKHVVTYCTGGIRCEVISSLLKERGLSNVYQIDGGILRYTKAFGDQALWEGELLTFDGREKMSFSDHPKILGHCVHCDTPTNDYYNCQKDPCHRRILVCDKCANVESMHCVACSLGDK